MEGLQPHKEDSRIMRCFGCHSPTISPEFLLGIKGTLFVVWKCNICHTCKVNMIPGGVDSSNAADPMDSEAIKQALGEELPTPESYEQMARETIKIVPNEPELN